MKIGDLSRATATKVTTIRFYEEIGLLDRPARTESGRRTYAIRDVDRLNFVRNGRRLGFSVEEIRSLIGLASEPGRDCGEAMAIASRHLASVEERLAQLAALRDELVAMSQNCDRQRIADCRVIQAIAATGRINSPPFPRKDLILQLLEEVTSIHGCSCKQPPRWLD